MIYLKQPDGREYNPQIEKGILCLVRKWHMEYFTERWMHFLFKKKEDPQSYIITIGPVNMEETV